VSGPSIVEFYSGESPDSEGRYLREIQQWPDARLESVHDFIQWLFPLYERSAVNADAPVLDRATVEQFHVRENLRLNLRASFERMLRFYGLELREGTVGRGQAFEEAARNWLRPGNHNHLRITRILKSLVALGLEREAKALFECLKVIYEERSGRVSPVTFRFWTDAVR
jgi:hypothetical protein